MTILTWDQIVPGLRCTVTRDHDLWFEYEARAFIDQRCVIKKITKAGLVQIMLEDNPKRTYSAPKSNILLR